MAGPVDLIPELKSRVGLTEAYHVTTFKGYRKSGPQVGDIQEVTVEIWDAGPERRASRYMILAVSEGGKVASGNPVDSIETALALVHWADLDK